MTSVGISRSGEILIGWDHVAQSLGVILSTDVAERIQRRKFGSNVPSKIDRPQNLETIIDLFMDVAEAIEPRVIDGSQLGEPRFRLTRVAVAPSITGVIEVSMTGDYLPNGHKGDATPSLTDVSLTVPVG